MSAVRFVRSADGDSLSVLAGTEELLAVIDVAPGTPDREAALAGFDAALDLARVPRPSLEDATQVVRTRVALYNPYTAEIAVGSLPDTVSYSDSSPLELPPSGVVVRVEDDMMHVGARQLLLKQATPASLSRAYVSHHSH